MKILVINCGSSSLKYQLIDMDTETLLAKGLCERIGIDGRLKHEAAGKTKYVCESPLKDHKEALKSVINALLDPEHGVISSISEIGAVGHRVAHGGDHFSHSVLVTPEVKEYIKKYIELAPLHNPANLEGIEVCEKLMPGVPMVAVFDTAFHQTMPEKAYLYAIPYKYYEKYKVRKYGFHGTSHKYVSQECARMMGIPIENLKIITCHLGNGGSVTAIQGGLSIDTSMGFTPLDGIAMGTRSGSIDPAAVLYLMRKENLSVDEMDRILNKESGVYGISGVSSDFRDIEEAENEGNERAAAALETFAYRVAKTIGEYVATMNGVDAIVFTAGLGENSGPIRQLICSYLGYLGIELDSYRNSLRGEAVEITTKQSRVQVFVIPTNEELVIARDTKEIVESL
ncbi:MAG: acetate kinase [Clostridia bacterium]|jgi:acetate kinase|nr:acetate kinase [Clostridia bacterium]MCI2000325.1 acetate kinase [Clostridia bacterium]MCI2015505.1 acetate kinase [Clostridia bacterium]